MSARDDYPDLAICTVESGYPVDDGEAERALDEIDTLRFRLRGVSEVMGSVLSIVNLVEASLQSGDARISQSALRTRLLDLRASYFTYLYAQQNPGGVADE